MAPIAPFFAEQLFTDMNRVTLRKTADSVHLSEFPQADPALIDKVLEEKMEMAHKISSMALSIRKRTNIRVRQPLNRILVPLLNEQLKEQIESVKNLILSEVNVKQIEYISDTEGIISKKIKPDFKKLGPKCGKDMKMIAEDMKGWSQAEIAEFEREKSYTKTYPGGSSYTFESGDAEIQTDDLPGYNTATMGALLVALDTTLTPELRNEGIARELVNRIQNLRKDKKFEVTDKIRVKLQSNTEMDEAVNQNNSYICNEILAQSFIIIEKLEGNDIDEIELTETIKTYISIEKMD